MTLAEDNEIIDAEVTISVASAAAPVDEEVQCTRKRLLSPPDWRYQEAQEYLRDLKEGAMPVVPSDKIVQYVIRGLRAMDASSALGTDKRSQMRYMLYCWPTLTEVLELGTFMSHSAITTQIEVCLIKGWDHESAVKAGCPVSRETYDLYSSVFFDLTGARAVHAWMQDFLFEPERYKVNHNRLRAMLMAFHGSGTCGINSAVTGYLTHEESTLLKRLMKNERQKSLFDYIVKHTALDPETYTNLMETALKNMTEHDFQEHMKDRDDAGTGSLEELGVNLENAIRVYSQTEVEHFNQAGVDFSNQYTQSLIGK